MARQAPDEEDGGARYWLVQQIVADCLCRRAAGEEISDESVIALHPDLRRQLSAELRKLRQSDQARQRTGRKARAGTSPPPARIILIVVSGPEKGRRFSFRKHDNFIVGRAPCAHFRLPADDMYFSRVHFMIEFNPPLCRLIDMGSSNGTYVNRQKVRRADLKEGDLIQGGKTAFVVRFRCARTVVGNSTVRLDPPPALTESCHPVAHSGRNIGDSKIDMRPADDTLPRPRSDVELPRFPGYDVGRRLGQGAMGIVYLCRRASDGAQVAIKSVRPAIAGEELDLARFLREARILEQLDHPRIVRFHEMGHNEGRVFFVMDYVPGMDAGQLLKHEGPLAIHRAVRLTCEMLEALHYAHAKGFVHRDIKPSNLLVTQVNGLEEGRLADFGLARVYHQSHLSGLTMMGDIAGTVPFMAPEQITHYRECLPPSDLYSSGATLYNLLTGKLVHDFDGCSGETCFLKILLETPVPIRKRRAEVPAKLAEAIDRSLARDPAARYADAGAMRNAILRSVDESTQR